MNTTTFNWAGTPSVLTTSFARKKPGAPPQLAPLQYPLARRTDPQTSHDAAAKSVDLSRSHKAKILAVLRENGPHGKDGIARLSGIDGTAVGRRLMGLQAAGLIVETGYVVPSNAGRMEREWRAV